MPGKVEYIMKLGKHVSISGGIDKAPERAKKLGCNCLQIFAKNPRGWKGRNIPEEELLKLKDKMDKLNMLKLIVHSTYLINLATPKDELWQKSINGLKDDYKRCGLINADYLVLHPGSHTGSGTGEGIKKITVAINQILSNIENQTIILLENVSGAGTAIGSNFREIHDIIKGIKQKNRIGICLDTCHAFTAGYNISKLSGIEKVLSDISKEIGLDKLKLIHINDSKYKFNTNKDEHAHIGEGYIGLNGFSQIINHPCLRELTFILETPQFDGEDEDVMKILSIRREQE